MSTTMRPSTGTSGLAADAIDVATPEARPPVPAALRQAALEAGRASKAIDETIAALLQSAVPQSDRSQTDKIIDDPFLFRDIATLKVRLHVAEAAIRRAECALDAAGTEATAAVAVAEAGVLAAEAVKLAAGALAQWTGGHPSAVNGSRNQEVPLRDAMSWRLHAIGDHVVNGIAPREDRI